LFLLNKMPGPLPPSVEALLAQERILVRQPYKVRVRAIARARQALRSGGGSLLSLRPSPPRTRKVLLVAAGGFLLSAGATAGYRAGQWFAMTGVKLPAPLPIEDEGGGPEALPPVEVDTEPAAGQPGMPERAKREARGHAASKTVVSEHSALDDQ
jgi:hypothetical protein